MALSLHSALPHPCLGERNASCPHHGPGQRAVTGSTGGWGGVLFLLENLVICGSTICGSLLSPQLYPIPWPGAETWLWGRGAAGWQQQSGAHHTHQSRCELQGTQYGYQPVMSSLQLPALMSSGAVGSSLRGLGAAAPFLWISPFAVVPGVHPPRMARVSCTSGEGCDKGALFSFIAGVFLNSQIVFHKQL